MAECEPLTDEEIEHLRSIRVCGCEDWATCSDLPDCPRPVLDNIGAAWIEDHFDRIIATINAGNR